MADAKKRTPEVVTKRSAKPARATKAKVPTAKRAKAPVEREREEAFERVLVRGRVSYAKDLRVERALRVYDELEKLYPEPRCELDYDTPFQLLIAVILSAQTTDKRVNSIAPALFGAYPDARALAGANLFDLREILRPIGFFRAKARAIRTTAKYLVKHHGGEVPRTMAELVKLQGVARKTANVVLGEAFGIAEGIAVDTHVARVAQRLGLTRGGTIRRMELDLMELTPRERWAKDHLRLVLFGRYRCVARSPKCEGCPLRGACFAPEAQHDSSP
ncbi:MAG: endonuclease III [Myxococcales bacterium]|nr:endonuclease III [Myxococcales bacterium]